MAVIMHVDMDSFYASVEIRKRPELARVPMWVGGDGRGVVLSANRLAKEWGVEGGMPSARAKLLCPAGIGVHPHFHEYLDASREVMATLRDVVAIVEVASIDEAYLDVGGALRTWGTAEAVGHEIRRRIREAHRLPCSAGIGPNRLVAKMASRAAKPDGLYEVRPDRIAEFLHPMPVGRLYGIGDSTAAALQRRGIMTVGDLATTSLDTLRRAFGPHRGTALSHLAWGRSSSHVSLQHADAVGVGNQETFAADTDDPARVKAEILRVASTVARRLRKAGVLGRVVTLGVRFADFKTISGSVTLPSPIDTAHDLYAAALTIYDQPRMRVKPVRRVGVRMSGLVPAAEAHLQPALGDPETGWRELERAADRINSRFGKDAVQRAALTRLPSSHHPIPPGPPTW